MVFLQPSKEFKQALEDDAEKATGMPSRNVSSCNCYHIAFAPTGSGCKLNSYYPEVKLVGTALKERQKLGHYRRQT